MKVSAIDIKITRIEKDMFTVSFIRDGKSFFCMEAQIAPEDFVIYRDKIYSLITTEYGCEFRLDLNLKGGRPVKLSFQNIFLDDNDLFNEDMQPRGFYTNLVISYPTEKKNGKWYSDRKACSATLDFAKAFYSAIISVRPELKSELIESVIEMNDLESFYERIA